MAIFENLSLEIFTIIMFFIAFYGLITSKKAIKSIIFILMLETSVIVNFLTIGHRIGMSPPISLYLDAGQIVADPLPQALMLTAIVISISVGSVNIIMLMTLFRKYKTTDWDLVKQKNSME